MHVQKGKDRAVGKSRVVVTNLVFVMSTRRRCFSCVCHAVCRNICVYLSSVTKLNRREKNECESNETIVVTSGNYSAAVIGSGAEGILRRYEIEWWGQVFYWLHGRRMSHLL